MTSWPLLKVCNLLDGVVGCRGRFCDSAGYGVWPGNPCNPCQTCKGFGLCWLAWSRGWNGKLEGHREGSRGHAIGVLGLCSWVTGFWGVARGGVEGVCLFVCLTCFFLSFVLIFY